MTFGLWLFCIHIFRTIFFFLLVLFYLVIVKMALNNVSKSVSSLVMGICLPSLKHNASKFKIQYFFFDQHLNMFFRKSFEIFAYDPQKICKTGDIVLVQELPTRVSKTITHKVLEIIYPCGDLTDPISGKKVVASQFRDEMEINNSLYGQANCKFVYESAPQRGWQEGRKDFSHRKTYRKYNEFDIGDENQNQANSTVS